MKVRAAGSQSVNPVALWLKMRHEICLAPLHERVPAPQLERDASGADAM